MTPSQAAYDVWAAHSLAPVERWEDAHPADKVMWEAVAQAAIDAAASASETATGGEPDVDTRTFRTELESAINRHSKENGSNTPDFILAQFLMDSLSVFDNAVRARELWNGRGPAVCGPPDAPASPPPPAREAETCTCDKITSASMARKT